MKKITLSLFLLSCVATFSQSVDYKKAPNVKGSNYFEIVKQVRSELNAPEKSVAKKKTTDKNSLNEVERANLKELKQFERWAYYWRDRVNPDGSFPSQLEGWKNAGLLDTPTQKKSQTQKLAASETWTNIGPQTNPAQNGYYSSPQLGRVNAFWRFVDPSNAANNILLVGAPTGGIWKSTDNGATWTPKFDTFAGIGITDIKGSSSAIGTPGVLYATTGDFDSSGDALNSIGVYKSTDKGDTWTATGLSYALNGAQLLGHLVVYDDNTVLVAGAGAIKRTTNGGTTWTDVYTGAGMGFARMASFGTNVVCTDSKSNIYFSTNSGVTWTAMTSSVATGKMAVCADDAGTFYTQDQTGQIKQLDLTAGTATNVAGSTIPTGYDAQRGFNMVLLKKGNLFLSGATAGYSSTDNAATWYLSLNGYKEKDSDKGQYVHSDEHQSGYLDAGNSFWIANDGGLNFINMDTPNTVEKPNVEYKTNGVINTQIYTISINPSTAVNDDFMMANQDNDGFSKENGVWVSVAAGDGVCSAIDYSEPKIRYLGGQEGALRRSDQAIGYTGNYKGLYLDMPAKAEFIWPFSLDTTNPKIAYGGFDDLYKSTTIATNDGSTTPWTTKLNVAVGNPISFDNQGANIAVVGATGLKYSTDSGATWATVNQPADQNINSFSIDATTNTTLYATVSGYNDGNKVFKSVDSGITWTNISTGLPNILMKKVLFKQNQTGEYLFVATELGVYFMTPSATSWTKLGSNLPNVIVNDMKINYGNNKLYIGTYGRGMWEINIENTTLATAEVNVPATEVLTLYPNPVSNGALNVQLKDASTTYDYMIYNIVGGQIAKGTLKNATTAIPLNNAVNGIYIIKLVNGNKVSTQKFLVKN